MWRALVLATVVLAGCGGSDPEPPPPGTVSGPLCEGLPSGDDPGAPQQLTTEPPEEALTWIPVITTFEAAVRASGIQLEDVTLLAPTDDAFAKTFDRQELDDLLLKRRTELAELVGAHIVKGTYSVAELIEAGEVTTLTGDTITVEEANGMARLGGRATTICADYAPVGARIHVIDDVLASN